MLWSSLCYDKLNISTFIFQLQYNHSCDTSLNSPICLHASWAAYWGIKQDTLFCCSSLPVTPSPPSFCCFPASGLNLCPAMVLQQGSPLAGYLADSQQLCFPLFSLTDSSAGASTPALYTLMYDSLYLLASSLPRNQHAQYQWAVPSGSSHFPSLCYLPPTLVIFFDFGNQCKYYTTPGQNTVPMGPKQKLT